jgi:hypothetical protein
MKAVSTTLFVSFIMILVTGCSNQNNIYNIDGYFESFFPGKPVHYNSTDNEFGKTEYYSYTDSNSVLYKGTYLKMKTVRPNNKAFLYSIVQGMSETKGGNILEREIYKKDGIDEVIYRMKSDDPEMDCYLYGICAIKKDLVCFWEIEECTEVNGKNSKEIFEDKAKYFKILY